MFRERKAIASRCGALRQNAENSFNGIIKSTDSFKVRDKYHFAEILRVCRKEISHESKVRAAATAD